MNSLLQKTLILIKYLENYLNEFSNLYSNFSDKNSIIENTVKKYKYEWGSDKILTNF